MLNSFYGFEMGLRALSYYRQGMDTAGHNISNADVEGYSRQRVEASTAYPFTDPGLSRPAIPGQIGMGVKMDAIVRVRDAFLDEQYREKVSVLGYWEQILRTSDMMETYISEPLGVGFQNSMNIFWEALQELSKAPEDSATRENLAQKAITLTAYMSQLTTNFDQYRTSLNKEVILKVTEANTLMDQIAALNNTIEQIKGVGGNPNDLLDKRDLLAEKLCRITGATVGSPCIDETDSDYKIDLNGKLIVQGDKTRHLVAVPVAGNSGFVDVQVADNLFNHVSNPEVALAVIEQGMAESIHTLNVLRMASQTTWQIGHGDNRIGNVTDMTAALNLSGSFGIQVGSQGTQAASIKFLPSLTGLASNGDILANPPAVGDAKEYSLRIAAGDFERVINVKWTPDPSPAITGTWNISDNYGNTSPAVAGNLNVNDISGFIKANYASYLSAQVSTDGSALTIMSNDRNLISFSDVEGDLMCQMKLKNPVTTVFIEVNEEDSLTTIANKINGAFGNTQKNLDGTPYYNTLPDGSTADDPQEWLRCLVERDAADGAFYLKLESNVVGEEYRINIVGGDDCGTGGGAGGSLYVAQRLGFINKGDAVLGTIAGSTSVLQKSQDAYFNFDNKEYLSSSNAFKEARLLTPVDRYTASNLNTLFTGLRLELKATGTTQITSLHHVKGGEIAGMLTARDDFMLAQYDTFDELSYSLVTEMNALHYAGHGTGDFLDTTGMDFFSRIAVQYGASKQFRVSQLLIDNPAMIAAAMGDGTGRAQGAGDGTSGDGSNALRLAKLKQAKVLGNGSSDFNSYYESFIAELGSFGQRAYTMYKNQDALVDQIQSQRLSVMGVNIDEEMLNIVKFQQAFNAASRYITTLDELLDRVINGMGRVGL